MFIGTPLWRTIMATQKAWNRSESARMELIKMTLKKHHEEIAEFGYGILAKFRVTTGDTGKVAVVAGISLGDFDMDPHQARACGNLLIEAADWLDTYTTYTRGV
jgi:hypothetical protein